MAKIIWKKGDLFKFPEGYGIVLAEGNKDKFVCPWALRMTRLERGKSYEIRLYTVPIDAVPLWGSPPAIVSLVAEVVKEIVEYVGREHRWDKTETEDSS